ASVDAARCRRVFPQPRLTPVSSSTLIPRSRATCSGVTSSSSPAIVARTTLIGLFEPRLFVSTSVTPTASRTARTGPPAITPVPGLAGFSRTRPAPCTPSTSCGIVPSITGILTMFRRACSSPLRIASATSFALPSAMPTCPFRSPTATSAVKEKRRPPLTTLATRFTKITFSTRSASGRTRRPPARCSLTIVDVSGSELQPALASAVGESGHAPVVQITAAVEHHARDPRRAGALRKEPARRAAQRRLVRLGILAQFLQLRCERRDPDPDQAGDVVDHMPLKVLERAVHHQPRALRRTEHLLPDPAVPPEPLAFTHLRLRLPRHDPRSGRLLRARLAGLAPDVLT